MFSSGTNKYYFQHCIGQSGIVGLTRDNSYLLFQGFIQPLAGLKPADAFKTLTAKVFPNPFTDHFTVSFNEETEDILYVTLFDLNGRIVYFKKHENTGSFNLDPGYLTPSVYFLKVNTTTQHFYLKMIKLRD